MRWPDPATLKIVLYPDPVLRQPCAPIERVDAPVTALAARMLELMHEAEGIGLAAPQVGVPVRLFVCNPTGKEGEDAVYVNPHLVEAHGADEKEEGCLSLPGVHVVMRRATRVVLEALDEKGSAVRKEGTELEARVWQHEIDHLDGRLIIDAMSPSDEIANRRALRQLEERYARATGS